MSEEKRNRITAAITVNVILLIAILAAVLIYQVVVMTTMKKKRDDLINETRQLIQKTEESENELDKLQSQWYLQEKLIEYGYTY